jgi:hypothetical protein
MIQVKVTSVRYQVEKKTRQIGNKEHADDKDEEQGQLQIFRLKKTQVFFQKMNLKINSFVTFFNNPFVGSIPTFID